MGKKKEVLKKEKKEKRVKSDKLKDKNNFGGVDSFFNRLKSTIHYNPSRSVGMKLFLFFFISTVVIVSFVGWSAYSSSKNIITDEVSVFSHQNVIQVREKLDMIYENLDAQSIQFTTDDNLSSMISSTLQASNGASYDYFVAKNNLSERLSKIEFGDDRIESISLFDNSGNMIANTEGIGEIENASERDWFVQAVEAGGRGYWVPTDPQGLLKQDGNPTFGISRQVKNYTTGSALGVVLIEIKMNAISEYLEPLDMGEGGMKYVLDNDLNLIYSTDGEGYAEKTSLEIAGEGKLSDSVVSEDASGNEVLLLYDQSPINNWVVAATVKISELTKSTSGIANVTIGMIIFSAVIAIVISFVMVRFIAQPLIELRNLMNEGAKGNLTVRVNTKRKDEIGELSRGFNQMMEQITLLVKQTNASATEVLQTAEHLSEVSKNTAISSKEISLATEQIAEGASTLAVEAEKGNEITAGITEQMNKVVDSNEEMGVAAQDVQKASEQGIVQMGQLIEKTNQTEEMTRSMVSKVEQLQESTASIRKVLDLLQNMTKQINILSLNATIEAARAGAAGKGFMVVADEIRKMADQSRQNIDMVGEITEKIQQEMQETVETLADAYPLYKEQMTAVKEASSIFDNVQEQMQQFVQRLDDTTQNIESLSRSQAVLSEAMSSVSAVSEESSATSEEVASLAGQQQHASEGLVDLADRLEKLSKELQQSLNQFRTE
ncbi:methyl-accepting chemotaxis protein [Marinicrinis lubricantis]|uniref:Methyl-accepting chemotaxis protein n=1 Tax=Marinicrinis lubricantis TaxID=2086470 RepID=A0ABW1IVM4_9BACL